MDPTKSDKEWSASEINMVKSLIARYNANNSFVDGMNKKHDDIINEVHAMFPMKEKHQAIGLYVDLVVQMMQSGTVGSSVQHSGAASGDLVNNNIEIQVEDSAMDNTGMFLGYPTTDTGALRMAREVPHRQPAPRMARLQTRFWTKAEHRLLIF
jgi:hypothetical protein